MCAGRPSNRSTTVSKSSRAARSRLWAASKESTQFFAPFAPFQTVSAAAAVRRSLALFAPFDLKCSTNIFSVVTCVRSNTRPRTAPFAPSNSHAPLGLFAPFAPFVSGRPRDCHAPFALFASIAPYERLQVAGVWVHALIPQRPPPLR